MSEYDIPVYSGLPVNAVSPTEAAEMFNRPTFFDSSTYPMLPWRLGELIGTTWINLQTYETAEVYAIQEDSQGKPRIYYTEQLDDRTGIVRSMIRYDEEGRCVIDRWVRIDHLPVQAQLEWYLAAIAHHRDGLGRMELPGVRKWKQGLLDLVVYQAQMFATDHGLHLGSELLNHDVREGEQLRLL
jgi:hypothetical protein